MVVLAHVSHFQIAFIIICRLHVMRMMGFHVFVQITFGKNDFQHGMTFFGSHAPEVRLTSDRTVLSFGLSTRHGAIVAVVVVVMVSSCVGHKNDGSHLIVVLFATPKIHNAQHIKCAQQTETDPQHQGNHSLEKDGLEVSWISPFHDASCIQGECWPKNK